MLPTRTFLRASRTTPDLVRSTSRRIRTFNIHTTALARDTQAVPLLINGGESRTGQAFEVKHPRTGEVVTKFHGASADDL